MINETIDFENAGPLFGTLSSFHDIFSYLDHLYLDANGVVHNCTHANNSDIESLANTTEEEMFAKIFQYIDNLFNIVKPRKTFFIAIDGICYLLIYLLHIS